MLLPAVDRYRIRLRFTRRARFHFLHGGVLHGLFCQVFGHKLPPGLLPYAPESGRVFFDAGDAYVFGLTLVGESRALAPRLAPALAAIGARQPEPGPRRTLEGNFEVEAVEALPSLDSEALAAEAKALAAHEALTLHFLSPLRLRRPDALQERGAAYLNDTCFPADHFLARLGKRLLFLRDGRYPAPGDLPTPPQNACTQSHGLLWIDLPIEGPRGGKQGRPRGMTLGGVLGQVSFDNVPPEWLPWLVLGRHLHAGRSTPYGFGRYTILESTPPEADPFQPAQTALARIADEARLGAALEHVATHSVAAGVDGINPETFALRADEDLPVLARALRQGAYQPNPWQAAARHAVDHGALLPIQRAR